MAKEKKIYKIAGNKHTSHLYDQPDYMMRKNKKTHYIPVHTYTHIFHHTLLYTLHNATSFLNTQTNISIHI